MSNGYTQLSSESGAGVAVYQDDLWEALKLAKGVGWNDSPACVSVAAAWLTSSARPRPGGRPYGQGSGS
jgi:hypothetical protein